MKASETLALAGMVRECGLPAEMRKGMLYSIVTLVVEMIIDESNCLAY
jgi:hypothetical protein